MVGHDVSSGHRHAACSSVNTEKINCGITIRGKGLRRVAWTNGERAIERWETITQSV